MFTLIQPTIALNDERLASHAQMWKNRLVKATDSSEEIINSTAQLARSAPKGKVTNITIRCHGNAGYLQLGEGFTRKNTYLFARWKGLVENIWITACEVASIKESGNGHLFCYEMANYANCNVIAPTEVQAMRHKVLPFGEVDVYEGYVLVYGPPPKGGVIDGFRLPSYRGD